MLKKILVVVAVLLVGFLGVVAMQPDSYSVSRKTQIDAPAEVVFAKVNSFKSWGEWSPWEKLDPNMKKTFTREEGGVGATYAWEGNDKVGKGKMEIKESVPGKKVSYTLEFVEPFASTADTDVVIDGAAAPVIVSWTMTGKNNFMSKAFGMFMNMDQAIGKDFEEGLANLKRISEQAAKDAAAAAAAAAAAPPPEPAAAADADGGVAAEPTDAGSAPAAP
jgi:hypothetical protein